MKMNYYYAISALIDFKNKHHLIANQKNMSLLTYLGGIELKPNYDSEEVPDVKMIAAAINLPNQKVNQLLYQTYLDLLKALEENPHKVSELVHVIYITTYDDYNDNPNKEYAEQLKKQHFWGEFNLPVTPRLGESINIDFLDRNIKYNHGVVTEIHHDVGLNYQRIIIYLHPYKNYFWMWEKLKDEHHRQERLLRSIQETR